LQSAPKLVTCSSEPKLKLARLTASKSTTGEIIKQQVILCYLLMQNKVKLKSILLVSKRINDKAEKSC